MASPGPGSRTCNDLNGTLTTVLFHRNVRIFLSPALCPLEPTVGNPNE
jgi:hypothetical protein